MDANLTKQLRDAGGLVGFTNEDEWAQLVQVHGLERVLESVVRVKKVSGRGAFISGVRVDLGAKAREPAPPKAGDSLAPGGPVGAETAIERKEVAAGASTMAVSTCGTLVDPGDVEPDEQVDEEEAPAEKAEATPERDRMQQAREARMFRVGDHYLGILRKHAGLTLQELAAEAGRHASSVAGWLSTHTDLVTKTGSGRRRLYWIKDDPRIAEAAAEAERRPASPIPKSTPCAQVTPTVEESAPPAPEVVQPPAAAPELVTGEDLRAAVSPEVRFDAEITAVARLSVIFAPDEFSGPLRPLLEKLLDVFAQRRGYTHTVRELAACQDLVGVRR